MGSIFKVFTSTLQIKKTLSLLISDADQKTFTSENEERSRGNQFGHHQIPKGLELSYIGHDNTALINSS